MKALQDEALKMLEEACKEEVKRLKTYVGFHTININNASVDMLISLKTFGEVCSFK